MKPEKAREILLQYNAWRRYGGPNGEGPDKPDEKEIGEAIDFAITVLAPVPEKKKPEREYYGC